MTEDKKAKLMKYWGRGGHPALHIAAFIGHVPIANVLLQSGGDVEATDRF